MKLWGDIETYNEVDIRVGTHRYAETAEVLLFAWAVDDGAVQVWDATADPTPPGELVQAIHAADEVWFHNSHFDRTVLRHAMPDLVPPLERWRDTMVQAMAHSLPASLGVLGSVLKLPQDMAKDKRGKSLIQLFCKPRPKNMKLRRATRESHPAEWAAFVSYARDDIVAMRECHKRMPMWNYRGSELKLWHLDQRINDRGVAVDLELAEGAVNAVAREQERLMQQTLEMTDGQVQAATQRNAILSHIAEYHGIFLDDLRGSTVERKLEDPDIPEPVKDLLRVRLAASTTSTAKYHALLKATSSDGRLRGLLQFNGASRTGRWAGRIYQPQNLPRPTLKEHEIEAGIEAIKAGVLDLIRSDVMPMTSSALRGTLVAAPGHKFVIADLSNIEGRALAWLAGEEWKLRAFRDFDTVKLANGGWMTGAERREEVLAGRHPVLELDKKGEPVRKGYDLYKLAYAASFSVKPEEVTKDNRQVGKVQELALGYSGGVGAFVTFAAGYGIDLDDLAGKILSVADPELVEEATNFLEWLKGKKGSTTYGLADDTFIACDVAKRGWRKGHPAISTWWKQLEDAFEKAVTTPKQTFAARTVHFNRDGSWLRVRLPSGRFLCYPNPRVKGHEEDGDAPGEADIEGMPRMSYEGVDQFTRKWKRLGTYCGKLAENFTQSFARDVLAYSMPLIEAAGYKLVMSVHDELIAEVPDDSRYSADHLAALMATVPPWASGLPLAAEGFEAYRYRK